MSDNVKAWQVSNASFTAEITHHSDRPLINTSNLVTYIDWQVIEQLLSVSLSMFINEKKIPINAIKAQQGSNNQLGQK